MAISFKRFCEQLGCKPRSHMWSWSAIARDASRSIFSLWAHETIDGRYLIMTHEQATAWTKKGTIRNGAVELLENFRLSIANKSEVFGILCYAKDEKADKPKKEYFEEETLLLIELAEDTDGFIAYVKGQVRTEDAIAGIVGRAVKRVQYAYDDLDAPPAGVDVPLTTVGETGRYLRNDAVRAYVLRRAKGACEYCGSSSFITKGGNAYLETHHVMTLATQGPDSVANVIALCPAHHREAHYGRLASELEGSFIKILTAKEDSLVVGTRAALRRFPRLKGRRLNAPCV